MCTIICSPYLRTFLSNCVITDQAFNSWNNKLKFIFILRNFKIYFWVIGHKLWGKVTKTYILGNVWFDYFWFLSFNWTWSKYFYWIWIVSKKTPYHCISRFSLQDHTLLKNFWQSKGISITKKCKKPKDFHLWFDNW